MCKLKIVVTLAVVTLLGMQTIMAQDGGISSKSIFRFGAKVSAGVSTSRPENILMVDGINFTSLKISYLESAPQFNVGLWMQKKTGFLFLDAQAMYGVNETRFEVASGVSDIVSKDVFTDRSQHIDLQVIAGLHSNGFRIGVGPFFQSILKMDSELNNVENITINYRKLNTGFSGAIGYDWGKWAFDLKFDRSFRTVGDHIFYGVKQSKFATTPDRLTLTLGYSLF